MFGVPIRAVFLSSTLFYNLFPCISVAQGAAIG